MAELDQDIHTLFEEIFTTKKFGKQTFKNIEAVYLKLQLTGIISQKNNGKQFSKELDELFDNPEPESDFSRETAKGHHQHWQTKESVESHGEARTEDKRKIRETFLRLTEIFHPDKVKDSETQTSNTEIMKSIKFTKKAIWQDFRALKSSAGARLQKASSSGRSLTTKLISCLNLLSLLFILCN